MICDYLKFFASQYRVDKPGRLFKGRVLPHRGPCLGRLTEYFGPQCVERPIAVQRAFDLPATCFTPTQVIRNRQQLCSGQFPATVAFTLLLGQMLAQVFLPTASNPLAVLMIR